MGNHGYDDPGIEILKGLNPQRYPPWQLLVTGDIDDVLPLTPETCNSLKRILELLPDLSVITVKTAKGDLLVSRDFPSGYTEKIDALIAGIFKSDPHIIGIVFPATATRQEHTATADDPHFLSTGKEIAAISTALKARKISPLEAISRLKSISRER